MAWENYPLALPFSQSLVTDFSWCDNPVEGSNKVSYAGVNPETVSMSDGYIIGDSNNGLHVHSDQYNYYFDVMYQNQNAFNGSTWYAPKTNQYGTTTISYISCINRDTGLGIFHIIYKWRTENNWGMAIDPYSGIYAVQNKQIAYRFLSGNPFIQHVWMSVPAISGNEGQYSINCSFIDQETIGDGVTTATSTDVSKFRWGNDNSIYNMVKNLVDQEETICGWSGYHYFTLTRHTTQAEHYFDVSVDVKFYLADGTLIWATNPSLPLVAFTRYTSGFNEGTVYNSYLGFIIDTDNQEAIFDPLIVDYDGSSSITHVQFNSFGDPGSATNQLMFTWVMGGYIPKKDNPYATGSEDTGGTNGRVTPQDDLPSNPLPAVDGVNTGMFTVWKVSDQDLAHIAQFLWSDSVIDNLKKYFNSVQDAIMGMYILPYSPTSGFGSKKFAIGNMEDSDYNDMSYMTSRYHTEDMGSFDLDSIWDSYLDFAPYTKLEIYLPYCGTHELNVDELMCKTKKDGYLNDTTGSVINVEYRIDCLTGACVVYLKQDDNVRYQFSGQMGTQLPVTSNSYDRMVQALIGATSALASTIAYAAVAAPVAVHPNPATKTGQRQLAAQGEKYGKVLGAAAGASTAALIQSQKPSIYRNGNLTGEASMIAYDRPYLIKTRPNKPLLVDQELFTGFPCYKSGTLGDYKNYTECLKVHLEDVPCTDGEKDMIEDMLISGVIINPSDKRSPTPDVTPVTSGNLVIAFLKNQSESECIGKIWDEENILKIEGKLLYDQSISNPHIIIEGDCKDYNYAYIPFFNRFYYISDIVVNKGVRQTVHFDVDPLQSFMESILESKAIIKRTGDTSKVNYYMNDGVFFTEQRQVVTYHCFKSEGSIKKFNTQQIYLITAGG